MMGKLFFAKSVENAFDILNQTTFATIEYPLVL
jgi:hypothetical protein